ncbi:mandelate racemase/muconate lactonizing enzyme family protein [Natronorarus salvus]|uniref:mandelate racemase/muconate lactonizing enzyme family protein n=1 Tax=Natronorarus salvus TaxID=3117733 RepID=UPI002F26554F
MRITSIDGYALSSPIDPEQERVFHGGVRTLRKRDVVLVVVETADGTRGVAPSGASSSAMREYFEDDSQGSFADLIEGPIAARLEGEQIDDPADVAHLLEDVDVPTRLREQAVAALDVALYDVRGRELGAPIYELLAELTDETPTTDLPLYASAGMYMQPDAYAEQAALIEDAGFLGYKYRPGIGPDGDRRILELLVERTGIDPMIDAHTWWKIEGDAYDRETVRSLVEHAGDHGAYWVEEPVAPDDYDGYRALSDLGVPLAGGESEHSAAGLIDLAETGSVSYLQGDVRHHGGFTGCWDAVTHCVGREIEYVPHNFGTWLGLIANAHVVAAAPETSLLEYPVFERDPVIDVDGDPGMYPFDLAFDVITGEVDVHDGFLRVPDGPGLGVDVDLSVVEEYPFIEGPWTTFDYDE